MSGADPKYVEAWNNLGWKHNNLKHWEESEAAFRKALALSPDHFEANMGLGFSLQMQNQAATARPYLKKSILVLGNRVEVRTVRELYQKAVTTAPHQSSINAADRLHYTGDIYAAKQHLKEAIRVYQASLVLKEQHWGAEHPQVAVTRNNLAGVYKGLGEYGEAKERYERALVINEQVYGPEHPAVARDLNNLGLVYKALGEYGEAKERYEQALAIAVNAGEPQLLWIVQSNLSTLLAKQGQREAAILFGKLAVNTLQAQRGRLSGLEEDLQTSFLKDNEAYYKDLADWLIEAGRLPEAEQVLAMLKEEEYFEFIRRDRETEDIRTTRAAYGPVEAKWVARYEAIKARVAALGRELAELRDKKRHQRTAEDRARIKRLRADLEVAMEAFQADLRELQAAIVKISDKQRYAELENKHLDSDPRGLLRALGEGIVLAQYLVLDDSLHILMTTPETRWARKVAVASNVLNREIQRLRQVLQQPAVDPHPAAKVLYDRLIAPIAGDLEQAEARTLMVSLDGALRYVPLAALHDGERYLVERYSVAVFTEAARDKMHTLPEGEWELAGFGLSRKLEGFDPLPAVPAELERIVRRDETDPDGVLDGIVHLDQAFTEQALKNALFDQYPVVHVASHFVFKPGTEQDSFLLLGDGQVLTLAQLREGEFDLNPVDLLTLSACETAMGGAQAQGREVEGLAVLAQKKGAKGVLATLWPVADASTGLFMQHLYRIREEKPSLSKAEALRRAQLRFIRGAATEVSSASGERSELVRLTGASAHAAAGRFKPDPEAPYAHPYYWAPFVLMGNWL